MLNKIIKSLKKHNPARGKNIQLEQLQNIIGHHFKDQDLLEMALSHTSLAVDDDQTSQFERMEFLGDAVLGLIASEKVFAGNPEFDEGDLSKLKSKIVSKKFLALKAKQINLGQFIYLSEETAASGGKKSKSILADSMETLICAIYLDGGLRAARKFVNNIILKDYQEQAGMEMMKDFKSRLQEYTQSRFQEIPDYRVVREEGPDHAKMFTVEVLIGGKKIGTGKGSNKKEAHQNAARQACSKYRL